MKGINKKMDSNKQMADSFVQEYKQKLRRLRTNVYQKKS